MSKLVGRELNGFLLQYLSSHPSKQSGKVILIGTTDKRGWPHLAMLSRWEIAAKNRKNLLMATYPTSITTENLKRNSRVTIVVVDKGISYYLKCTAKELPERLSDGSTNTIFSVKVEQVLEDKLQGAKITSGIKYREKARSEPHLASYAELLNVKDRSTS